MSRNRKRTLRYGGGEHNGYAAIVAQTTETIRQSVPAGSIVLVVSKGDERLVEIDGRRGWHFPRTAEGCYAGFYPRTGDDAVAHLEELRAAGAAFLAFPNTAFWWLDHYPALRGHLEGRCKLVVRDDTCVVFDVRQEARGGSHPDEGRSGSARADVAVAQPAVQVTSSLLPPEPRSWWRAP